MSTNNELLIENNVVKKCNVEVTNIIIPEGITEIGNCAFKDCTSLTSIEIPNSVTGIGMYAFEGCTSLRNIKIPDSVTKIGDKVFLNCTQLTTVIFPKGIQEIRSRLSDGCQNIKEESIPLRIKNISWSPSKEQCELTEIEIPKGVEVIKSNTFMNCKKVKMVIIHESVTRIAMSAFSGCKTLTSLKIPDSVTKIESDAFSGCIRLMDIVLPDGLKEIEWRTFSECKSLKSIKIPNSVIEIGSYAFENCLGLKTLEIPEGVYSIGNNAFHNCQRLTSVKIAKSVTELGDRSFSNCKELISIELNDNLLKSGSYQFSKCNNINHIKAYDQELGISYLITMAPFKLEVVSPDNSIVKVPKFAKFVNSNRDINEQVYFISKLASKEYREKVSIEVATNNLEKIDESYSKIVNFYTKYCIKKGDYQGLKNLINSKPKCSLELKKLLESAKRLKNAEITSLLMEKINKSGTSNKQEVTKEIPLKKSRNEQCVRVEFDGSKSYLYSCSFDVSVGDIVFVDGKLKDKEGIVTEIDVSEPSIFQSRHVNIDMKKVLKALHVETQEVNMKEGLPDLPKTSKDDYYKV